MNDGNNVLEMPSTGWLVPFLLLGLREHDRHGHELRERVADLDFGETRREATYRTLRQIERRGLIASEQDGHDHELSLRRYSITSCGEAYLELWADSLAEYQEEIDLFLSTYAESTIRGERGRKRG